MLKHGLPFLLIALIALQSVVALAGGHLVCEDDKEHSALNLNDPTNSVINAEVDNDNCQDAAQDADDCHTCGHCHGHFSSALLPHFLGLNLAHYSSQLPAYLASSPPLIISRFLRPPIV
ncbi:MAG: hypothetical protein U5M23_12835 [Marinagarivorans sp.]|nr:hypothetical protein [Marinagarivorans sp.]